VRQRFSAELSFFVKTGAPGETRTPDPLVRSQMLYPAELRAREATSITLKHLQPLEHLAFRSISVHSVQQRPFWTEV
jgi:hypothetical protein